MPTEVSPLLGASSKLGGESKFQRMSGLGRIRDNWESHDTRRTISFVFAVLCALAR